MVPAQLEQRVETLEKELASLKSKLETIDPGKPWWERIAGTFRDDPIYKKAMKLGQQYRQSLRRTSGKRSQER